MAKQKIRIYPKVYRLDNDSKELWRPEEHQDKIFLIQEKIDGSNITFGIHNGVFGIYSRTQEITNDGTFGKTDLQEILDLKDKFVEEAEKLGLKTLLVSGELLGQAKLNYNKTCSGKLEDSFWMFDVQFSTYEGKATDLRDEDKMLFGGWGDIVDFSMKFGLNLIPMVRQMTYKNWNDQKDSFYKDFVQDGDKLMPSLIDDKIPREGVVVKIEGTGMRYKIVSSAFKERDDSKGADDEKLPIPKRILNLFATGGRIDKVLQKLQMEGKFDGDTKNKKNYQTIFSDGSRDLVEDILEEEIKEITDILRKEMRRSAANIIKKHIESDGKIMCACCEKVVAKDDLHPEFRTCPLCGKYALKRKVMKFNKETNENYLLDQVTGEIFSAITGKKHKFEKEGVKIE